MQDKEQNGMTDDPMRIMEDLIRELDRVISDPDGRISGDARQAISQFLGLMEDENKRFLSGDIAMDPLVLKKLRDAAVFFRKLEREESIRVKKIYMEPGLDPAYIETVTSDGFVLAAKTLIDMSDILKTCDNYELYPDDDGAVHFTVYFSNLWKSIPNGGEEA